MKRAPRSRQRHDLYAKYHDYDSEISDLLGECGVKAYEELCASLGEQPANVGLAWLLHQPAVTAPIIGPRTMEHLDTAERAVKLRLDTETLEKLDDIFPGYKTAPEHYAW